ncbi:MAG: translocation/assembly module TamB domain-containing protein [Gemmatimonadota bacterium]|nr:translocation/assembly module TamB domain-containing protein [Gemmatimonadota bacterium]
MRRVATIALGSLAVLVTLAIIALLAMTNSDIGRAKMRSVVFNGLRGRAHGIVHMGRLEGNLLTGFTIHDLSIADSTGQPFLSAEQVTVHYRIGSFLSKRIHLTGVRLVRPIVVLSRLSGGKWNYRRIFRSAPSGKPATGPGFGSWVTLDDVTVDQGQLMVRTPWTPNDTLSGAARDSAIAVALGGESRTRVERVPGGFQKVTLFRDVTGALPYLRVADPDSSDIVVNVRALRMVAELFRPPAANVTDLNGTFTIASDSVWFRGIRAALTASRISGDGAYFLGGGDLALRLHGDPVALSDLRWLYPRLPSQGGGRLDFVMRTSGHASDYAARNAAVRVGDATATGSFGIRLGDTTIFHDTDLRVASLDTRLIEQLVPHLTMPRRGVVGGRAALSGPLERLRVNADISFADARSGTSRLAALGEVGIGKGVGFRARDLHLRLSPVQVDLLRIAVPSLPVGGSLAGTALVNGATQSRLVASGDLTHRDGVALSRFVGRGAVQLRPTKWFDIDIAARPIDLAEAGRFAPSLGLRGKATGPIRLTGPLADLALTSDLLLPDGGSLITRGRLDLASAQKGYDLTASAKLFNLHAVLEKGPASEVTAEIAARGRGFSPATMTLALAADLSRSQVDSVPLDSVHLRMSIADGLARVDSTTIRTPFARATLGGDIGLVAERTGEISYVVQVDSLSGLRRWLPPGDTAAVQPASGRMARRLAQARRDSAKLAQATEVEREATGRPAAPQTKASSIPAVRGDSLAGSIHAAGRVRGSLADFDLRGRAAFADIVARGSTLRRGKAEYAWTRARTPSSTIAVGVSLDSLQAVGLELDSVEARVSFRKPGGRIELAVYQDTGINYSFRGDYELHETHRELHLANLRLQIDTTLWYAANPSAIQWGPAGIDVKTLDLRSGTTGRVYVNGLLPTKGNANLEVAISGLQIADVTALLQRDLAATGMLALDGKVQGTQSDPRFRGAAGISSFTFRGTAVPDIRTTFDYERARLVTKTELLRSNGLPLAVATGSLPINLSMGGYTGPRMLDEPLVLDFRADSLPLDAVPRLTDAVADIHGRVMGTVAVRGSLQHPRVAGAMALDLGSFRIVSSGTSLRDITGMLHMQNDSIVIDSIVGNAHGRIAIRGGLGIRTLSQPSFDLTLDAKDALILDNDQGRLFADADIRMTGPFDKAVVRGDAYVTRGVVYVPEPTSHKVISASDPAVFSVIDTSVASNRALVPTQSALMSNLVINVGLRINRGTWVRSPDGNIEIFTPDDIGPLRIRINERRARITVAGSVATERGDYAVAGRRFTITHGSVTFIPAEDQLTNPLLQLAGEHEVQFPGREALVIQVIIGGTAHHPRLTLTSNAQPPISESDLLSYLAFGRSSSSLLQQEGSSVSGQSNGGGSLAGNLAALATRQLASVALGAVAHQFTGEAARSLGADEFNIQPADVPAELSTSGALSLLQGTQIEAGKYINPSTFLALQVRPSPDAVPGIRLERRLPKGLQIQASFEPRYLVREPTFSTASNVTPTGVLGLFLIRERRF